MLAHDRWATRVLLERCRPLTRDQFHQRFPIGVGERGGLHLTFTHILSARGRWADRIRGIDPPRAALEPLPWAPPPGHPSPDARDRTVDELLDLNDRTAADLADALARSRAHGLGSTFPLKFPRPGGGATDYTFTRAAALTHVLTHAHWHRAQAVNMLRRLNVPGVSDGLPEIAVVEWQAEGEAYL
jgi:uncharacterized damage-inducible protein DinB